MECWSIGVLEYWSIGVLEYWGIGVLEYWGIGVMGGLLLQLFSIMFIPVLI